MSDKKQEVADFLLSVAKKDEPVAQAAPAVQPKVEEWIKDTKAGAPSSLEAAVAMLLEMQVENQKLTQMMFQREARKEQEEQALIQRIEQRDKQRKLNAREFGRQQMATQAQCKHQKGLGKGSMKGPVVDYAVYLHTFIDHSQTIKCRICKMTWHPRDTKEFLMINGAEVRNHTKIGWSEGCRNDKAIHR